MAMPTYNCGGCRLTQKSFCAIKRVGLQDSCPCRNCLVIVMCEETCDELDKHGKRALEILRRRNK